MFFQFIVKKKICRREQIFQNFCINLLVYLVVLLAVVSLECTELHFDLCSYDWSEEGEVKLCSVWASHRNRTMEPFLRKGATNHKQSLIINSPCSFREPGSAASWLEHVTAAEDVRNQTRLTGTEGSINARTFFTCHARRLWTCHSLDLELRAPVPTSMTLSWEHKLEPY